MSEFVVGQWVWCAKASEFYNVVLGRFYRIREVAKTSCLIEGDVGWKCNEWFKPVEWKVGRTYRTEMPGAFGKILSIDETGDLYGNVVGSPLILSNYWHAKTGKDFNEQRGANLTPYLADEPSPAVETSETSKAAAPQPTRSRYHRTIRGATLDLYDIAEAYGLDSHRIFHAVKKLVMAGRRGHKDRAQDLREAVVSIESELQKMKGGAT